MDYRETLTFLYENLPMFQRTGHAAYKANLDNTLRLDEALGHPHRAFRTIHVAGTNGKGSVSHLLAAMFMKAGYDTALYTSPHLLDFRERIRVNGEMIPREAVTAFVQRHRRLIDEVAPSFFEITALMAFDHFRDRAPHIAIIETGMGGRLDSTNIIHPELSVITNNSMDHARFLGDTPTLTATEKAGIIKEEVPVVLGKMDPGVVPVFTERAAALHAPLFRSDQLREILFATETMEGCMQVRFRNLHNDTTEQWSTDLRGIYQQENLQTALAAADVMRRQGWDLPVERLALATREVSQLTKLRGRWEILAHNPQVICDTGHNEEGMRALMQQLAQVPAKHLHMIFGMVDDKEAAPILKLLPTHASYYFVRASIPRSADPGQLREKAGRFGLQGTAYPDVSSAIRACYAKAGPRDVIFIGGSTFVVADALAHFPTTGTNNP